LVGSSRVREDSPRRGSHRRVAGTASSLAPTDTTSRTTPTRRVTTVDESETSNSSHRAPPYV
jgi:hypothetical protein